MKRPILERAASKGLRVWRSGAAYLVDLAVAPFVHPEETVILSGFWRSGTTWLQEAFAERMGAKTVFEPFRFRVDGMQAYYRRLNLPGGEPFLRAFMPCARTEDGRRLVRRVIGRGLRSALRSDQVRMYRETKGARYSLRRRVVLKIIRSHLALAWIAETFPNPIVHMYRDPRAVIASAIYKTSRMWGVFEPFDLAGQLLGVNDGRVAYFSAWENEIKALNERPFAIQFAAYWALTERCLLDRLIAGSRPVEFVRYEDLVEDPAVRIPELLERLSVRTEGRIDAGGFAGDSPSTTKSGQDAKDRLFGWRKLLSGEEIETIESIAHTFGLADRLVD